MGLYIIVQADRVHEDEGAPRQGKVRAIAARTFVGAVIQIKVTFITHDAHVFAELGIDRLKDVDCAVFQCPHIAERAQWFTPENIHLCIPGPQRLEIQQCFCAAAASAH